mmetsp:Transcript_39046/g.97380  ORF Transcript_39046/g.97380 Transcript_39046/m.97380 type:complete len:83 (+) Transcript_39046:527-775(+)|eukprot:649144-Prymnesium_polylepis.1
MQRSARAENTQCNVYAARARCAEGTAGRASHVYFPLLACMDGVDAMDGGVGVCRAPGAPMSNVLMDAPCVVRTVPFMSVRLH